MFGDAFTSTKRGEMLTYFPFGVYINISPFAANGVPYLGTIEKNFNLLLWVQSFNVAAPNDGVNYWKFELHKNSPAFDIIVVTLSTQGLAANSWLKISTSNFSPSNVDNSYTMLYLSVVKFGAPGVCYVGGPALRIFI
jgi:hypothetical protein